MYYNNLESTSGFDELGKPLNENLSGSDGLFDESQSRVIEDTLPSEGIQSAADLEGAKPEELVDAIDKRVSSIRPELKSKVNMSYFGQESGVWNAFRSHLGPKYLEAPSDKVQQEQIGQLFHDTTSLRFENWSQLSVEQRVQTLNSLERMIADIEHRPAATVSAEKMSPENLGYQTGESIVINESEIINSGNSPEGLDRLLDTLVHEGRHRYQNYNVEERMVHESKAEVDSWRQNYEWGYKGGDPEYVNIMGFHYTNDGLKETGARLYYYQPVEIDAREFAADAMEAYHKLQNA